MKDKIEKYNQHIPASKTKGFTEKQITMLDKHAKKHSKKHVDKMILLMKKEGKSFSESHKIALAKIGK